MTKKKIMMAAMSAGLVAVVGLGGTLAYLSAQSNDVTNTFTVGDGYPTDIDGHQGIWLDEKYYQYDEASKENLPGTKGKERTEEGVDYIGLKPGDTFTKDPTVHMVEGSVESYVFVAVDGVADLESITVGEEPNKQQVFDIAGWNVEDEQNWVKLNDDGTPAESQVGGDGYYVYKTTVDARQGAADLEPIFDTFTVLNVNELPDQTTEVDGKDVRVVACAIQTTQTPQGIEAAFGQAKGELDALLAE